MHVRVRVRIHKKAQAGGRPWVCVRDEQVWMPALQAATVPGSSPAGGLSNAAPSVPMEVVYRLQGLDGEATEPLVDTLLDTAAVEVDPEVESAMTALMSETSGLSTVLQVRSCCRGVCGCWFCCRYDYL